MYQKNDLTQKIFEKGLRERYNSYFSGHFCSYVSSFWDAVANRDLTSMIKECARDGLPKRNKATQDMLRKLL